MKTSNTYLNVPFAQKDEAKALGAKWDPLKKKWYAPGDKDLGLFTQWLVDDQAGASTASASKPSPTAHDKKSTHLPPRTYPLDKNFKAYDGPEPPWME